MNTWSRHNLVWARPRWASLEDDPGRVARLAVWENGEEPGSGRLSAKLRIREEFLTRAILIACPESGCRGILLTGAREVERSGGNSARIIMRCTRDPEHHEFAITMDAYDAEEVDDLKASLYRGEQLACVRCGTPLELGSVASQDGWAKSLESGAAFYCSWCGVRWVAPNETSRRAG